MSAACCRPSTHGTANFFSRWSKSYARRFRKGKLEKVQRYLLDGIRLGSVNAKSVLDIGCGVGALHLTLLKEGARQATGIDLSGGMLDQARRFAGLMGVEERTKYVQGDFVEQADSVAPAEITMLDKVVCCYEDVGTLVRKSTEKTLDLFAVSHPRENFLVEFGFKIEIALSKLFRAQFHPYWHNWGDVQKMIVECGFELLYHNSTFAWNVAVYRRQKLAA